MKPLLAFFAGLACALTLKDHKPKRQWIGYRCANCGQPAKTEGELLGVDDTYKGAA